MDKKIVPYTEKEKSLIAALVKKYYIVENKKTDSATIQQKQLGWESITIEYNSQGGIISRSRNATQLKKLWNNLKQRKRKASVLKNSIIKTEIVTMDNPYPDVIEDYTWDNTSRLENCNSLTSQSNHEFPDTNIPKNDFVTETEYDLNVKRIKENMEQEKELHKLRMEIEIEQLNKVKSERRKAEAEEKLAILKLQIFKNENNL